MAQSVHDNIRTRDVKSQHTNVHVGEEASKQSARVFRTCHHDGARGLPTSGLAVACHAVHGAVRQRHAAVAVVGGARGERMVESRISELPRSSTQMQRPCTCASHRAELAGPRRGMRQHDELETH